MGSYSSDILQRGYLKRVPKFCESGTLLSYKKE